MTCVTVVQSNRSLAVSAVEQISGEYIIVLHCITDRLYPDVYNTYTSVLCIAGSVLSGSTRRPRSTWSGGSIDPSLFQVGGSKNSV